MRTVFDTVRRKLTIERPAKPITDAADTIMQGDFSVRGHNKQSEIKENGAAYATPFFISDCFWGRKTVL